MVVTMVSFWIFTMLGGDLTPAWGIHITFLIYSAANTFKHAIQSTKPGATVFSFISKLLALHSELNMMLDHDATQSTKLGATSLLFLAQ